MAVAFNPTMPVILGFTATDHIVQKEVLEAIINSSSYQSIQPLTQSQFIQEISHQIKIDETYQSFTEKASF